MYTLVMLKLKGNYLLLVLGIFLFLISCVDKKISIYNPDEVGIVMATSPGIVEASRKILISGLKKDTQYWGAAIGATLAGAMTYGLTGGDNELEEAAIIISVILGAMTGTAVEEMRNKSEGIEYTIKKENGDTVVVVQAITSESDIIPDGSRINIVSSNDGYVRVTLANS